jgi:GNAT superfamily N-acetyltransferase
MQFLAPVPLSNQHQTEQFSCGVESLDAWLKRRALKNQVQGASRTYVVCQGDRVMAYYAIASGVVTCNEATGRLRRNMPDPIPVVVLGRLGVDSTVRGQGLGRALVRDAAMRILQAADMIGIRGMTVQALSDDAKVFYEHMGFEASPIAPNLLMITLADLKKC